MKEVKKRRYIRKCGACGNRFDQSEMVRSDESPNGWFCQECAEHYLAVPFDEEF